MATTTSTTTIVNRVVPLADAIRDLCELAHMRPVGAERSIVEHEAVFLGCRVYRLLRTPGPDMVRITDTTATYDTCIECRAVREGPWAGRYHDIDQAQHAHAKHLPDTTLPMPV